jgi:hypothetical protein
VVPADHTLHRIQLPLGFEEALRGSLVRSHECGRRQFEILEHAGMKCNEIGLVFCGQYQAALCFAHRGIRQAPLDDIACVSQIDRKIEREACR